MRFNVNRKWLDLFLAVIFVVGGIMFISTVHDLKDTVEQNRRGPACVITLLEQHREGSFSSDMQLAEHLGFKITPPEGWDAIPLPKESLNSDICKTFIKKDLPKALTSVRTD